MTNKLLKQVELSDAFMESVAQSIRDKIVNELGKEVKQRILSQYKGRDLSNKIDSLILSELKTSVSKAIINTLSIDKGYLSQRLSEYVDDQIKANTMLNILNKLDNKKLEKLEKLLGVL